jgi:SAM-dependent methyltransferase
MQLARPAATVIGADYHEGPPAGLTADSYVPYSRLPERRGQLDLILLRHVLEHTYHPVELLVELRELLRPGGAIVIEVPALDAKVRLLFGRDWNGWYVPAHTMHFSRRSLARILEGAGLRADRIEAADMPMMGRSIQSRRRSGYGPGLLLLGILLQPAQLAIGALTRTSVNLRAWAIPSDDRPR